MLNRKGKNNLNGSFDWKDALIDALITAGITACTVGVTMTGTGLIYSREGQLTLVFSVLGEFLIFLAVKRGLREKKEKIQ